MDRIISYQDKDDAQTKTFKERTKHRWVCGTAQAIAKAVVRIKAEGHEIEGVYKWSGCEMCGGKGYQTIRDLNFDTQ